MFTKNPFPDTAPTDTYRAPVNVAAVIVGMASNMRYANMDGLYRNRDPRYEPEYINVAPQHSPFDHLTAPPLMLPSGSR